jgi:hypothetical protein
LPANLYNRSAPQDYDAMSQIVWRLAATSLTALALTPLLVAAAPASDAATAAAPSVTTEPASAVRSTGATLAGAVNANGTVVTECLFEYGTTASLGQSVPCAQSVGGSSEAVRVSAALGGLKEGTVYYVKLRADNAAGAREGTTVSLETTRPAPPAVSTGRAIAGESTATFTGSLDPGGSAVTKCAFEYGATTAYGQSAPCAQSLGEGSGAVAVTGHGVSLLAGTAYHFRLMAANGAGAGYGSDAVFETTRAGASGYVWPAQQPLAEWGYGTYPEGRASASETGATEHTPRVSAATARCLVLGEPTRDACLASVADWRRLDAGLSIYHCAAEAVASLTDAPPIEGLPASIPGALRAKAANTSEAGWPADECLKMDKGSAGQHHTIVGVARLHNWLLGGYGSDTIIGGDDGDVIWADYHECCWPRQTAVIRAGNGRNVIYANDTHDDVWTGTNPKTVVHAHVIGISGVIHCQSPRIVVFLSTVSEHHFRLDGCHHISHYSVGY